MLGLCIKIEVTVAIILQIPRFPQKIEVFKAEEQYNATIAFCEPS